MFRYLSSKCAQRLLIASLTVLISHDSVAAVYYVRQTVGDDSVYPATNILIYGNTLFRNENCDVYFASSSSNGSAIRNVTYENYDQGPIDPAPC